MKFLVTLVVIAPFVSARHTQNLTESYAPIYVDCPQHVSLTRSASEGLHSEEEVWIHNRKRVVTGALSEYLSNANLTGFDIDTYMAGLNRSHFAAVPGIGVAISGGGFASAIMGAGLLRALDARESMSVAAGTGGLLQSLSYFSGQSGGSWIVSSEAAAEYPMAEDLLQYWQPQLDKFAATTNGTHEATPASIFQDVVTKAEAGFNVSVADFLGRLLGYEFIRGPKGGLNATMSNIKDLPKFQNHQVPMPIVQIAQVTDRDTEVMGLRIPTIKTPIVWLIICCHQHIID
jgi:lysophospholipase